MVLQTTGPISLSDIQTEFGGTNPISLNEYYAGGGLTPSGTSGTNGAVPTSGAISLSQFYGTQAALDVQTVTVGFLDLNPYGQQYGFAGGYGSISDGTSNIYGGAAFSSAAYYTISTIVQVAITGTLANSGWTNLKIGSTNFTRASATFTSTSPSNWQWTTATNPFGTTVGAQVVMVFT